MPFVEARRKAKEGKNRHKVYTVYSLAQRESCFIIYNYLTRVQLFQRKCFKEFKFIPRFSRFHVGSQSECSASWAKLVREMSTISRRHCCPWLPADYGSGRAEWTSSIAESAGKTVARPATFPASDSYLNVSLQGTEDRLWLLQILPMSL